MAKMLTKITTISGAVYTIDHVRGLWKKNDGFWNRTLYNFCFTEVNVSWTDILGYERLPLTVGLRMYISGKDEVWISTEIASIEDDE